MSHVTTPRDFPYPWYMRLILWRQRRRHGRELEPARLWGRIPGAFPAMTAMYRTLDRVSSPIEPPLRSLLQVRVSQINHCDFCIDLNSHLGQERGISMDKLQALPGFEGSALFTAREKAALRYAEAVTRPEPGVSEPVLSELRAHFSEQEIVELAALVAFQNMSSKFNAALGVPAEGFCAVPVTASRK
jgi:AhpD family alkylhydroperoxidase